MKNLKQLGAIGLLLIASIAPAFAQVDSTKPTTESPVFSVATAAPTATASPNASVKKDDIDAVGPRLVNRVVFTVFHQYGMIETIVTHNQRTDAGASAIAGIIGNTTAAAFTFAALTTNATAVAKGDTVCTSEYTTGGLARVAATFGTYTAPSVLNGSASYIETATWTSTTNGQTVNKICMFNASSSGTMGFETVLGSTVTLNNGDTGALTWTFNV